jgi:hypothetical protein
VRPVTSAFLPFLPRFPSRTASAGTCVTSCAFVRSSPAQVEGSFSPYHVTKHPVLAGRNSRLGRRNPLHGLPSSSPPSPISRSLREHTVEDHQTRPSVQPPLSTAIARLLDQTSLPSPVRVQTEHGNVGLRPPFTRAPCKCQLPWWASRPAAHCVSPPLYISTSASDAPFRAFIDPSFPSAFP